MPRTLATVRQIAANRVLATGRVLSTNRTIPSGLISSLVAYWKLEELSGIRVDATMRGNDLTDVNTVTQNPGKVGSAAQFAAPNGERLSRADNADLSTGAGSFTLVAWVYLDSLGVIQHVLAKWSSGSTNEYRIFVTASNKLEFRVNSNSFVAAATTALGTGAWHFVVAWFDSVALAISIQLNDGTVVTTSSVTAPVNGTSAFAIGARDDAFQFFNGRIDEVGLWKRVLTAAERTALYNAGVGRTYPFLGT